MAKTTNYQEELISRLKDLEHSVAYLNAALIDEDSGAFSIALRNVIEAQGGISVIAKKTGLNRESMYKTLSGERDSYLSTLKKILDSIGLEFKTALKPQSR